jgi:hypothetical protein
MRPVRSRPGASTSSRAAIRLRSPPAIAARR